LTDLGLTALSAQEGGLYRAFKIIV